MTRQAGLGGLAQAGRVFWDLAESIVGVGGAETRHAGLYWG